MRETRRMWNSIIKQGVSLLLMLILLAISSTQVLATEDVAVSMTMRSESIQIYTIKGIESTQTATAGEDLTYIHTQIDLIRFIYSILQKVTLKFLPVNRELLWKQPWTIAATLCFMHYD